MKEFLSKQFFFITIISSIVVSSSFSLAKTIIVAEDGSGDFTSIQAAIDSSALSGDTIFVKNGIYEGIGISEKELVVIGESNYSTIVGGVWCIGSVKIRIIREI